MAEKTKKKNKSALVGLFVPFDLRKLCNWLMVIGAILILAGLIAHAVAQANVTVIIGLIFYAVASVLSMYRCLRVMLRKDINKKSNEYKNAVINLVIMAVFLILSILGIVAAFIW